jgi:hypothetical protein
MPKSLAVPAVNVLHVGGHLDFWGAHEVCGHTGGDVSDGKTVTRDVPAPGKLAIENGEKGERFCLVHFAPLGDLRLLARGHRRAQVPERRRDRSVEIQLGPSIPHLNRRDLARIASEQIRLRLERVEKSANCHRLRDRRAVVENQHGHALHRIDGGERVALLLETGEVDLPLRDVDSLLREENADTARIGRTAPVDQFHSALPPRAGSPSCGPTMGKR